MMKLKEILVSANGLGGLLQAGVPLDAALERMQVVQPNYDEFWMSAAMLVGNGRPLSECLTEIWPAQLVKAVQAGEQAGKLQEVFQRIQDSLSVEQGLRSTIGKLAYPLGSAAAGLVVAAWFFIVVIPNMMKAMTSQHSKSAILSFAVTTSEFVSTHWPLIAAGVVLASIVLVNWIKSDEGRATVVDLALGIPRVREALRDLYFGLWAYYLEMALSAGIPTTVALSLTAPILPDRMRESVDVFNADMTVNNRSMGKAADLALQEPGDPRRDWWPFYIANSFILGEQTGLIDAQLRQCAPVLIKEGSQKLTFVVNICNVIAIALAASLILAPMGAYYAELFNAARMMGK